jgi:hypothetical protein
MRKDETKPPVEVRDSQLEDGVDNHNTKGYVQVLSDYMRLPIVLHLRYICYIIVLHLNLLRGTPQNAA